MPNGVDPCALQFTFENNNYRILEGRRRNQNLSKDHPVQESRVGRIFRQTDLNYSSWDARTADTKKIPKKSHLTGRHDD